MIRMPWTAAVGALALAGCSTYSFGPPQVSQSRETINQDVSETCLAPSDGDRLKRNVEGALDLIDNYVGAYRCTLRIAADGRQAWQVPGFLSLITATMAAALGGGRDWAIAGGSANAMFNAGNAYYDNVGQAAIVQDALKSFSCIQTEAVGVESFIKIPEVQNAPAEARETAAVAGVAAAEERLQSARQAFEAADTRATFALNVAADAEQEANRLRTEAVTGAFLSAQQTAAARRREEREANALLQTMRASMDRATAERSAALAELAAARDQAATLGSVMVTAEQQYFNMVAAVLQRVEATAAGRLAKRGTYKPEDVVTLIEALAKKAKEAEDAAKKDRQANMATGEGFAERSVSDRAVAVMTQIELELAALRPKLDKCLVHAAG
jgi:hypothetical protein